MAPLASRRVPGLREPTPPLDGGAGHAERTSGLRQWQCADLADVFDWHHGSRSAQSHSLRPGSLETRQHALSYALALKLNDRTQDVHLELPGGRRRVDLFVQRHERYPEGAEFSSSMSSGGWYVR